MNQFFFAGRRRKFTSPVNLVDCKRTRLNIFQVLHWANFSGGFLQIWVRINLTKLKVWGELKCQDFWSKTFHRHSLGISEIVMCEITWLHKVQIVYKSNWWTLIVQCLQKPIVIFAFYPALDDLIQQKSSASTINFPIWALLTEFFAGNTINTRVWI